MGSLILLLTLGAGANEHHLTILYHSGAEMHMVQEFGQLPVILHQHHCDDQAAEKYTRAGYGAPYPRMLLQCGTTVLLDEEIVGEVREQKIVQRIRSRLFGHKHGGSGPVPPADDWGSEPVSPPAPAPAPAPEPNKKEEPDEEESDAEVKVKAGLSGIEVAAGLSLPAIALVAGVVVGLLRKIKQKFTKKKPVA